MIEKDNEMAQELQAQGLTHGQIHPQIQDHYHEHWHGQMEAHVQLNQVPPRTDGLDECHRPHRREAANVLALRSHSGVAGDMLLAGMAVMYLEQGGIAPDSPDGQSCLQDICAAIMPDLASVSLCRHMVNGVRGWQLKINLPSSQEHRHLADIAAIIAQASMRSEARDLATACFQLLARCEGEVHGIDPEEVHFHEVGALDSILDICATCELYARLGAPAIHCGSLPIADGQVHCAHGVVPAPAPATLRLLRGIPVHPFPGDARAGELLTPTGLALLKTFQAQFGPWPHFRVGHTATVFGQREFAAAPNGLIFALGSN